MKKVLMKTAEALLISFAMLCLAFAVLLVHRQGADVVSYVGVVAQQQRLYRQQAEQRSEALAENMAENMAELREELAGHDSELASLKQELASLKQDLARVQPISAEQQQRLGLEKLAQLLQAELDKPGPSPATTEAGVEPPKIDWRPDNAAYIRSRLYYPLGSWRN